MPRMAAATTAAAGASSTRIASSAPTAPTAPTAACANRCQYQQPVHPPARASAWRRVSIPIAPTAAPAPSSRCAPTAPAVWALDRGNSCNHRLQAVQGHRLGHHRLQGHRLRPHRLPACATQRALECTLTAPIATMAAPATTVAPAPSSPTARVAPTGRTAPRAHSRLDRSSSPFAGGEIGPTATGASPWPSSCSASRG